VYQKYFVLFVLWGCLGCCLYLIAGIEMITSMFVSSSNVAPGFVSLMTSLLTGAFAIALLFFAAFHLHLVLTGQSTIEASLNRRNARRAAAAGDAAQQEAAQRLTQSPTNDLEAQHSQNGSNITLNVGDAHSNQSHSHHHHVTNFSAGSRRENWDAVFGTNPWLWFIPVDTLHETGYEFDFLLEDDEDDGIIRDLRENPSQQASPHMSRTAAIASALQLHVAQHVSLAVDDTDEAEMEQQSSPSVIQTHPLSQQQPSELVQSQSSQYIPSTYESSYTQSHSSFQSGLEDGEAEQSGISSEESRSTQYPHTDEHNENNSLVHA
jgi:hypothetical protein